MKKTALSILVLALSALYSIAPLLMKSEFIMNGGWDLSHHINWVNQISLTLKEGVLYPHWMSGSNGGYGSPTGIFYSTLFHRLAGIVNLFVPSLVLSLKIVTFAGFLFSGLAMFIFLRNFCGHAASIAGGIAYQLFPYHIFDLYVRESLGETFAFIWLPLIMHFAYKGIAEGGCRSWIGLSLSYASLVLTHNASAYMFTYVVAAFFFFFAIRGKKPGIILKFSVAILFGLSVSAVYFIPMVFERRFVHMEWMINGRWGGYRDNFLFKDHSSLDQLEGIVMLLTLVAIVSLILVYYRKKRFNKVPNFHLFSFFFLVAILSLFMTTPYSVPLWRMIPEREMFVFPWRWVIVSTFATSVLIGLSCDRVSFTDIKRDRPIRLVMAVFHGLLIANIYLASVYIITAKPLQKNDLEWMLTEGKDLIEYRPVWHTQKEKEFSSQEWVAVTFVENHGTVKIISWKSHSRLFTVNATLPSVVRVSTFYYPGWTALINGKEIPISIEKDSGAMLLSLPAGENTVLLEFRDTPLRRAAKWVSIISLFAAFTGLIVARLRL